jgi:hypothetical protein
MRTAKKKSDNIVKPVLQQNDKFISQRRYQQIQTYGNARSGGIMHSNYSGPTQSPAVAKEKVVMLTDDE